MPHLIRQIHAIYVWMTLHDFITHVWNITNGAHGADIATETFACLANRWSNTDRYRVHNGQHEIHIVVGKREELVTHFTDSDWEEGGDDDSEPAAI